MPGSICEHCCLRRASFFLPEEGHFSILEHWNAMITSLLE
jgi:hypothetical protein